MTSSQESSKFESTRASVKDVESLAGLFHPHAIEVQDFSYYRLILDVRPQAEFDDDHIPGAVRLSTAGLQLVHEGGVSASTERAMRPATEVPLPTELATFVAPVKLDHAILVYCGRGGRDSLPVAKALRWRGWTVDVLPGGWNNYRRWVQAGLEALPRLVTFRVVTASLGSEMARLLGGLSRAGEQVLDVAAIAGWRNGAQTMASAFQPTQAAFESRLLHALRKMDPRGPVWVADVDRQLGGVSLPGALLDAFAVAPPVALACPLAERLARWREDEPWLNESFDDNFQLAGDPTSLVESEIYDSERGRADTINPLARLLADRDARWRARTRASGCLPHSLPPLVTASLAPDQLLGAIEKWLARAQPLAPD